MDDLRFLERSYEELTRFLRGRSASNARLLAVSRFVAEIPLDLRGRKYYLEELAPAYDAALREVNGDFGDPEALGLAGDAYDVFSSADLLPPGIARPAAPDATMPAASPPVAHSLTQIHVAVPLVQELPPTLAQGDGITAAGSMVEITVVPCPARWGRPEFRWNNGNVEEAVGDLRSLRDVAADALLAAKEAVRSHVRGIRKAGDPFGAIAFDLSLPEKVIPVVGDSAGLALAAAAAYVYFGALRGRAPRQPLPDIAWTGRIEPSGEVKPVDALTLRAKLRAAFFGGCTTLVLPRGQGAAAEKFLERDRLAMRIMEIGHVAEIFNHESLFEPSSFPPSLVHFLKFRPFWRAFRRTMTAAAILGVIYASPWIAELAGLLFYPPWHPAPEWAKAQVELLDKDYAIKVDVPGRKRPIVIRESAPVTFTQIVPNLDTGEPGKVYLVYGCSWATRNPGPGKVIAWDLEEEKPLWTHVFTATGLPYNPWGDKNEGTLSVKTGYAADVDGDGFAELLVTGSLQPWAPTFLWLFSGDGRPRGVILHTGHLEEIAVKDLDADDIPEIVVEGLHNASNGLSLISLHADQFVPFHEKSAPAPESTSAPDSRADGETDSSWDPQEQPCNFHMVIPMIPDLSAMEGRPNLGMCRELIFYTAEKGWYNTQVDINVLMGARNTSDYVLTVSPRGEVVGIYANAPLVERARYWISEGMTDIDFSSREVMEKWIRMARTTDTIQLGWESDTESPH